MIDRKTIRNYFKDFRYLASSDKPNILREFVRYDDVLKLIEDLENLKGENEDVN